MKTKTGGMAFLEHHSLLSGIHQPDSHVPSAQFVHLCVWLGRWGEGVCLEKAGKGKRDRKTTEGREPRETSARVNCASCSSAWVNCASCSSRPEHVQRPFGFGESA